jgi:hypothetical protein
MSSRHHVLFPRLPDTRYFVMRCRGLLVWCAKSNAIAAAAAFVFSNKIFCCYCCLTAIAAKFARACIMRKSFLSNCGKSDEERQAARRGRKARTRQLRQKGTKANFEGVGFRWGGTCPPSWKCHVARLAARTDGRSIRTARTRGRKDNHGYMHLVTANDVQIAGELGASGQGICSLSKIL